MMTPETGRIDLQHYESENKEDREMDYWKNK